MKSSGSAASISETAAPGSMGSSYKTTTPAGRLLEWWLNQELPLEILLKILRADRLRKSTPRE